MRHVRVKTIFKSAIEPRVIQRRHSVAEKSSSILATRAVAIRNQTHPICVHICVSTAVGGGGCVHGGVG